LAALAPLYKGTIFEAYLVVACALALVTIIQRLRIIINEANHYVRTNNQ
jgi:hypothetical protein